MTERWDGEEHPEETTAVTHLVTDQGNGGALCRRCGFYEDMGIWLGECPRCRRKITEYNNYIPCGGSDY